MKCKYCDKKVTSTVVINGKLTGVCDEHIRTGRKIRKCITRSDTCYYCGFSYHPMPTWIKDDTIIYVCDMKLDKKGNVVRSLKCSDKARKDGYTKRDKKYQRTR